MNTQHLKGFTQYSIVCYDRYLSLGDSLCRPTLKQYSAVGITASLNKKDGHRQQNVRQRQKIISIIDYDVCMTFY